MGGLPDNDVHDYFIIWGKVEKFDFITFLGLIKKIAIDTKNNEMLTLTSRNIHHLINEEKERAKISLILNFAEKMESENKARAIYKEPSIYDRFDD
jgi:hypothetical protein